MDFYSCRGQSSNFPLHNSPYLLNNPRHHALEVLEAPEGPSTADKAQRQKREKRALAEAANIEFGNECLDGPIKLSNLR